MTETEVQLTKLIYALATALLENTSERNNSSLCSALQEITEKIETQFDESVLHDWQRWLYTTEAQ